MVIWLLMEGDEEDGGVRLGNVKCSMGVLRIVLGNFVVGEEFDGSGDR